MIKANGEYLDFNGDIEIESRIKLFQEISTSNGDFSYDIQLQDNGFNRKILGIPRADTVKIIYQTIPSEVINDDGQSVYLGKLQVNRIEAGFISTTFFAGNTEWFAELSEPLNVLPLYKYDVDLTEANIEASWSSKISPWSPLPSDEGIVFPIIDTGALVTRSFANLKVEDFTPCFYVKTLFKEIFYPKGIKLDGDFMNDTTFNKLVVASNQRSQDDVDARSSYVNKTASQTGISSTTKITFQDETTFPYFDGSQGNFSSSTYTADVRMRVKIDLNLTIDPQIGTSGFISLRKNGAAFISWMFKGGVGNVINFTKSTETNLNAGDTLEVYALFFGGISFDVTAGNIKITPFYIYKIFGNSSVPNWTQGEFVSNIFRLFNVLPSYNTTSKTLTLDLFNNIKNKEYVDISQEVVVNAVDFTEFVKDYGKNNYFKYQESEDEDLRQYNISNFISYGSGNLTVDNDYIENSKDIIESDFTSPITYLNGVFDMSMERINFVELDDVDEKSITSVTDASDVPRFNMGTASSLFAVGDLVRIESNVDTYNGEWVVNAVTSTYITVNGPDFDTTGTGTATLLRHKFTTDDNVYLFINSPNLSTTFFSSKSEMILEDNNTFNITALAYFNLLSNNTLINHVYKQSLSFGAVNNPLDYQLSLLDTYWPLFSRILNDPVMLPCSGYLKKTTFDKLKTFLRPVMIQTEETRNLYYLNKTLGYKDSSRLCELELIKLN